MFDVLLQWLVCDGYGNTTFYIVVAFTKCLVLWTQNRIFKSHFHENTPNCVQKPHVHCWTQEQEDEAASCPLQAWPGGG